MHRAAASSRILTFCGVSFTALSLFFCSVSHFARSFLSILVYCSQVFSLLFVFPSHHSFLEFYFCFVLTSILSISSFFSLQRSNSKLHTFVSQDKSGSGPWSPIFFIIVDVCFVRFPQCSDNVISQLLVREGHFFLRATIGPRGGDLAIELLRNSIPLQLLETIVISFTPLPTQGTMHLIELTGVILVCTQLSQLHSEVAGPFEFFRSCSASFPLDFGNI